MADAQDYENSNLEDKGGVVAHQESVAQSSMVQTEQLLRRLSNRQVQLIAIGMHGYKRPQDN
jgi:amino acid permease